MSFEERASEADPASGIQHGFILAEETLRYDTTIRISRTRLETGDFQEKRKLWSSATSARAIVNLA